MTDIIMGTPSCVQCRSTDVAIHGRATWDNSLQKWTLQTADLGGMHCANCGTTALRWDGGGVPPAEFEYSREADEWTEQPPPDYVAGDNEPKSTRDIVVDDLWTVLVGGFVAIVLIGLAFLLFPPKAEGAEIRAEPAPAIELGCVFEIGTKLTYTTGTDMLERNSRNFGVIAVRVGVGIGHPGSSIDGVSADVVDAGNGLYLISSGIVMRSLVLLRMDTAGGKGILATYEIRRHTGGLYAYSAAIGSCWPQK